jgi:hypothetical protein
MEAVMQEKVVLCQVCKEPINAQRLGVRIQVSPELHERKDGNRSWKYATICEPCLAKKLFGDVEGEF